MQNLVFLTWFGLILLLARASASSRSCPPSCKCQAKSVDCAYLGLQEVPTLSLSSRIKSLDLSGNNFTTISLQNMQYIKTLSIGNNPIQNVSLDMDSLATLDLTGITFNSLADVEIKKKDKLKEIKGLHVRRAEVRPFAGYTNLQELELRVADHVIPWNFLDRLKLKFLTLFLDEAKSLSDLFLNSTQGNLRTFKMTAPKLKSIQPRMLERLIVIREIYLDLPSVKNVSPNLFRGELRYAIDDIYLPNTIRPIVKSIMDHLSNSRLFEKITLKNIHTLPDGLFNDLGTLKEVNLKQIEDIPEKVFEGLMPLEVLDLSNNDLEHISMELFKELRTAKSLNLSCNQLTSLEEGAFGALMSVEVLDLSHNHISHLDPKVFHGFRSSLRHLNLSNNAIEHLPINVFKGLLSVQGLHMNNMSLLSLHNRTFADMKGLKHLHLRSNKLRNITKDTFRGPEDLLYIDLSDNELVDLPQGIFDDLTELLRVNLANNLIERLPPNFLSESYNLEELSLQGNSITCDCSLVSFIYSDMNITCSSPPNSKGKRLQDTGITEEYCSTTTQRFTTTEITTPDITTTNGKTSTESVFSAEDQTTTEDDTSTKADATASLADATVSGAPENIRDDQITTNRATTSAEENLPHETTHLDLTRSYGDKITKTTTEDGTTEQTEIPRGQNDLVKPAIDNHNNKESGSVKNKQSKKAIENGEIAVPPSVRVGTLKENEESTDFLPIYLWIVIILLIIIDVIAAYLVYKKVTKSKEKGKPLLADQQDTFC